MNTNLIPIGVKQGKIAKTNNNELDKLDEYLREETMTSKEEKLNGHVLPQPTYRDKDYNNTDSRLGNYDSITSQQNNMDSDIAAAMAANTIQSKREIYRIEELNNSLSQIGSQFGLVEASKRQHKKGQKIHRLSQQSSWM